MTISLSDRNWKQFKLSQIFKIESCKCSKISGLQKGDFPYVGATNRNNGVLSFIKSKPSLITKGNCVAFICDGEGSVGYSIYKAEDFIGSTTVKVGRNDRLNRYNATFITTIADTVRSKYNFGFKRNETHLKNEILMLPVNSKGNPDYEFMETYMKQKEEQDKLQSYIIYIKKRIEKIQNFQNVISFEEKEWKEFSIGSLFKLVAGKSKGLNHLKKTHTGINYLGATNLNNAVLCQIEEQKELIQKGNCIAFIRNGEGSMGYSVYKLENFIATSDISVGYNSKLNRYNGMFITTIADRVRGKYNFGYKRSSKRLSKELLILPIDSENQPDYEYMENYMKKIEYEKLTNFLSFKGQL